MARFVTGSGLSLPDTHTGLAPRALRDIRAGQNAGGLAALDADVALCAVVGGLIGLLRLGQDHPERMPVSSDIDIVGVEGPARGGGHHQGRPAARCKAHGARLHGARHTAGTMLGEQHVDIHVIPNPRPGHHYSDLHRAHGPAKRLGSSARRCGRKRAKRNQNCNRRHSADHADRENPQVKSRGAPGAQTQNSRIKSRLDVGCP
jgi:tetracycline repressor-like protein